VNGVALRTLRVSRVAETLARYGERLPARAFTSEERAYCEPRRKAPQHFAVRLAAKFAARQLLKMGRLAEIEVVRDAAGAPALRFHGAAAAAGGDREWWLSLSHDEDLAVALVVTEAR
jgi:holo-[acyl-carrier protein] synthase